jgi:ribosomal protein S18 acetylase RimI-like enzyme
MFTIQPMTMEHYERVLTLWKATEGMGLSKADTPERIAQYLERNSGFSLVAFDEDGVLAGAALCGHDGRRGYLHHVAVRADRRGKGLGRLLVERCLDTLRAAGIDKCHLFVYGSNQTGRAFWSKTGWYERPELVLMSKDV